eukprot:jgi/Botrbrau1/14571/Bobra.27_3s0010.1
MPTNPCVSHVLGDLRLKSEIIGNQVERCLNDMRQNPTKYENDFRCDYQSANVLELSKEGRLPLQTSRNGASQVLREAAQVAAEKIAAQDPTSDTHVSRRVVPDSQGRLQARISNLTSGTSSIAIPFFLSLLTFEGRCGRVLYLSSLPQFSLQLCVPLFLAQRSPHSTAIFHFYASLHCLGPPSSRGCLDAYQ